MCLKNTRYYETGWLSLALLRLQKAYGIQLFLIILGATSLLVSGSWYSYTSTFDTATVGLMSVNILNGESPLFFYGQPYFGALEAYIAAFFVALFGFSEFVVSLGPITITLLSIFFSYKLFSRIHNNNAGIVAAICIAFPGYYIFWYSIATYGGYPLILCLGTALIWLSLVVFQDNPKGLTLLLYSLIIGIITALAFWVHALTFPYIGTAAGILILYALKEKMRPDILLSFALALLIAIAGFLPIYFETGAFFGGISTRVPISFNSLIKGVSTLFGTNIYELVIWNFFKTSELLAVKNYIVYGNFLVLVAAIFLALFSLFVIRKKLHHRLYYLIPISFCLLFILMYVQHHMATVRAPRYGIAIWSMLLPVIWTLAIANQNKSALRYCASGLFLIWILLQISGTILFIMGKNDGTIKERKLMREVVNVAKDENLKSIVTYGDVFLGYKAQKLSMYSRNSIVFAHASYERYRENAQFTEVDDKRGYLANMQSKDILENILLEHEINFKRTDVATYSLFSKIEEKQRYKMRMLEYDVKKDLSDIKDRISLVNDGNQDIPIFSKNGAGKMSVTLDAGKSRPLCGLWMFSNQSDFSLGWVTKKQFEVFVSQDGKRFQKIHSVPSRSGIGFHAGDQFYIGGPLINMEVLFPPIDARYVKILFAENFSPPVTEILLFQSTGKVRRESDEDINKIKELIDSSKVNFVFADRWMSANLLNSYENNRKDKIALERPTNSFSQEASRYIVRAKQGNAVVCNSAIASFCRQQIESLYGGDAVSRQVDFRNYSALILRDSSSDKIVQTRTLLLWNGHVPLKTNDIKVMAQELRKLGAPIWKAEYSKTEGFLDEIWTDGRGVFTDLDYELKGNTERKLVINTYGYRPDKDPQVIDLKVIVNSKKKLSLKKKTRTSYIFSLTHAIDKLQDIEISTTTFVPKSRDSRNLGLDIKCIEVQDRTQKSLCLGQ